MSNVTTLGIDLAKNVFQLHGVNECGKASFKKRVSRDKLPALLATLPNCLIGMEACGSSHYWATLATNYGHTVKLMPPQFVKPYVKSNKNDAADAEACCEAVTRPSMRFVPIKNSQQLEMQGLHRIRSRLIGSRTQLTNQVRGLLLEHGITCTQGHAAFVKLAASFEQYQRVFTPDFYQVMLEMFEDYNLLVKRIAEYDKRLERYAKENPACQRLMTIPGVGPITATMLACAIGNGAEYKNGRHVAAWLGLVPQQHSSGDTVRLGRISKRGDRYLRSLMIHGARAMLRVVENKSDPYSSWVKRLLARKHTNAIAVAIANKNARIAWSLLRHEQDFDAHLASEHFEGAELIG